MRHRLITQRIDPLDVRLDEALYNALQLVQDHKGPFELDGHKQEAQDEFHDLVAKLLVLRDKGLINLPQGRLVPDEINAGRYRIVYPQGLTYSGTQVLRYGSFKNYQASIKKKPKLSSYKEPGIIDAGGHQDIHVGWKDSGNIIQRSKVNPEVETLLEQIETLLKGDPMLSKTEIDDYLVDVTTLRLQLAKHNFNQVIVAELLSSLGSIASARSRVAQLDAVLSAVTHNS